MKGEPYNVVCLKHGDKYDYTYVNKLYNMVCRHTSLPIRFHCLTENSDNIHTDINIIPLPDLPVTGWWYKPYLFSSDLKIKGTILYIDLDVIITGSIDKLFSYQPRQFCISQDFVRKQIGPTPRFNSSVMKYSLSKMSYIWRRFKTDYSYIIRRFHGDQDYIYSVASSTATHFPAEWILSYKWEVRKSGRLNYDLPLGRRTLVKTENPTIPDECCIAVFHGDPKPDNCQDPYVIENWT